MDRQPLESYLEAGLSLEKIGKRVGLDASTVGYWVMKHGLTAAYRDRHAPRGGLKRADLEAHVGRGESIAAISRSLEVSESTVQYWLRKFGLRTTAGVRQLEARRARAAGVARVVRMTCRRHGASDFCLQGRGYYRCMRCRSEAVVRRRRKVKGILVREAGGRCRLCGYDRSQAALVFHHLDPSSKTFGLSYQGFARSLDKLRAEARKCALLCANCHAEVEAGIVSVR